MQITDKHTLFDGVPVGGFLDDSEVFCFGMDLNEPYAEAAVDVPEVRFPAHRRWNLIWRTERRMRKTRVLYERMNGTELAERRHMLVNKYLFLRNLRMQRLHERRNAQVLNWLTKQINDTLADLEVTELYIDKYIADMLGKLKTVNDKG